MLSKPCIELLKKNQHLLALSGGIDSLVLAHLLIEKGISFEAAHVNFKLRNKESDQDQAFLKEWALKNNIQLHVNTQFDATQFPDSNLQQNARTFRYNWFQELLVKQNLHFILTAHHHDDNLETFFIQFLRSSGLSGLKAIPFQSGNIVRPLISISRKEIETYAFQHQIVYRHDSSNAKDNYLRNRIRHHLLPLLSNLNGNKPLPGPSFFEHLQQEHRLLIQIEREYKSSQLHNNNGVFRFSRQSVLSHAEPKWALHQLIKQWMLSATQEENLFSLLNNTNSSGKEIRTATHRFEVRGDYVWIQPLHLTFAQIQLNDFSFEWLNRNDLESLKTPENVALLDADKINFELLSVRFYQKGDWFIPFGMEGKKMLSDFFKDLKWPVSKKDSQPILCCGHDIVWVVNARIDKRFAISERTQKVLRVKYKPM